MAWTNTVQMKVTGWIQQESSKGAARGNSDGPSMVIKSCVKTGQEACELSLRAGADNIQIYSDVLVSKVLLAYSCDIDRVVPQGGIEKVTYTLFVNRCVLYQL